MAELSRLANSGAGLCIASCFAPCLRLLELPRRAADARAHAPDAAAARRPLLPADTLLLLPLRLPVRYAQALCPPSLTTQISGSAGFPAAVAGAEVESHVTAQRFDSFGLTPALLSAIPFAHASDIQAETCVVAARLALTLQHRPGAGGQ